MKNLIEVSCFTYIITILDDKVYGDKKISQIKNTYFRANMRMFNYI
jgi:hypothetical protein